MPRVLLIVLALQVLACATSQPPPSSDPTPAAPPPPPAALFLVLEQPGEGAPSSILVPLACYEEGQLEGGRRCLGLIRRGSAITLEGGEQVRPTRRAPPRCEGMIVRSMGLSFEAPKIDSAPWAPRIRASYGVWPRSAAAVVWPTRRTKSKRASCRGWCTFGRTGHPRVAVADPERARLERAARRAGWRDDGGRLEVLQEVTVDLDRDGTPEQLYSTAVRDLDAADYAFGFSALSIARSGGARIELLKRRDQDAITVRGTTDLDRDGKRELWLLFSATAGPGLTHQIVDAEGALVGAYGCRPAPQ